jgi:hypothetical protein
MLLNSPGEAATLSSATAPADKARAAEYEPGPYKDFADDVLKDFASIVPPEADVSQSRTRSSSWSIPRSANDLSGCTLARLRTAPK